ncbi:unnamed protein product, partial [Adineta ricciae]
MKFLCHFLENNKTITTLNLSFNQIQDDGAKYLADVLKQNQKLKTLDLRSNRIGNIGAQQLEIALKQNKTLEKLILTENNICEDLKNVLRKQDNRLKFVVLTKMS